MHIVYKELHKQFCLKQSRLEDRLPAYPDTVFAQNWEKGTTCHISIDLFTV